MEVHSAPKELGAEFACEGLDIFWNDLQTHGFSVFDLEQHNQFRGPGYFDTDFDVEKSFAVPKWESAQFSVGAGFFNLFNHPNFAFSNTNADSSQFGQITQTASQPTTICGSGLGADASPRVIELQAKFVF